ncbi:MAG: protocatechuate 3,4-dioxygenase [Myxococcales bacterium]|nr:protocatechuate 3,4-dioxygenase [Myxococcales bacterium]
MTDQPARSILRTHQVRRREVLRWLGVGGTALLAGCTVEGADDEIDASTGGTTGGSSSGADASTSGGSSSGDASTGSGGESDGETSSGGAECGDAAAEWASGGTAAMTAKACYPDPFVGAGACALICETTEGPCTADTIERQDVSEGFTGLPVRLALKIVDADTCEPVAGARVEIWHTQRTGVYSGVTPSGMMCYGDDPDAVNYLYFRGTQSAGADGRVDFDTCYPGWYSGRAIHIHFRIYIGADLYVTSQLFFDDAQNAEIFASHPEYASFGQPDTTNTTDNVIGGESDLSPYVLTTARMPDGAMLASKVIAIRGSLADPSCSAKGAGGGMMPPP